MKSKTIKKLKLATLVLSASLFVFSVGQCVSDYRNKQKEIPREENKFYRLIQCADKWMTEEYYKKFMRY